MAVPAGTGVQGRPLEPGGQDGAAPYGATLALTVTIAVAAFALLVALAFVVVHPSRDFLLLGGLVNQQNQTAKTAVYLLTFLVLLPLALFTAPRLSDAVARGASAPALGALTALLAGSLAAILILVRVSAALPWGDGVAAVLGGCALWALSAAVALRRALRPEPWTLLLRASGLEPVLIAGAGLLVFGVLLCLTRLGSVSVGAVAIALAVALAVLWWRGPHGPRGRHGRFAIGAIGGRRGRCLDVVLALVIALAVPDLVIFHASPGIPNLFFAPGIVQSQHDFFLGPVNQLLAGGTLLVNSPGSQYGVGSLYFLAAWFHLVPIGYGSFGLLDGLLTALFYAAGYVVLRAAGLSRSWAAAALALAVVVLVYHFAYRVGVLPEQGPLRFGMPMLVVLGAVVAARGQRHRRAGRALMLVALGTSAIWAIETFGFTLVTFAAVVAMEAWLRPGGARARWVRRQGLLALGACVAAQVLFAAATLAGSGRLPDWGQYYAYVHSFLLGGAAGQVTYGFADWSPALAFGAVSFASVVAIFLLARRRPAVVDAHRSLFIALAATSAYSVGLLSYVDSRSSTYVLPYVALPTLLTAVLWLGFIAGSGAGASPRTRSAALAFGLAVAVLLIGSAWPTTTTRFSSSALAHAYPGGGTRAAIHRLLHPPAIDPRTPEGVRLLNRYVPGSRPLVLLGAAPDLATEILMHARRANRLAIGDPGMDSYVPGNWTGLIGSEIRALRPGARLLTDTFTLGLDATLRARPGIDPIEHPLVLGGTQIEWILEAINRRFALRPVARAGYGLVIAQLVPR